MLKALQVILKIIRLEQDQRIIWSIVKHAVTRVLLQIY